MEKYLKYSLILLTLLFAGLTGVAILTNALETIVKANIFFLAASSILFLVSIMFWIIPWALLIKKNSKFSMLSAIVLGFSCVYGALTPVQVGAEALRAIKAKDILKVSYSESISAAMVVKGIKFFLLGLLSSGVLLLILVETELSPIMLFGLLSGFVVIALASALFLLPMSKRMGDLISDIFSKIAKVIPIFKVLEKYFRNYSAYLKKISLGTLIAVFLMASASFALEFTALLFAFFALGVNIDIIPLTVLFVIISILERTPVLPRGLGLVEAAGFIFLSIPDFALVLLTTSQIGAILVLFDVVRLVVPTLFSLAVSLIKLK
ncbi:MAG: flippase-like domain-containing protein [archaeon]